MSLRHPFLLSAALCCWLAAAPALALTSDAEQPMHVSADDVEYDLNAGILIYIGNVEMDQGTLRVTAQRITVHTENDAVTRVIAEGDLAHYQQQQDDGAMVNADAKVITYYSDEQRVELNGNARLDQDQDSFRGEFLRYDIARRVVDAKAKPGASNGQGRIEMVINPRGRTPAGSTAAPAPAPAPGADGG